MSSRVFVGGLTYKVRERDLEKFFKKYGRIREISMKNGYAFVEFDDHRDAEDAVYELNGRDLLGERITVERARGTPRGSDMYRDRSRGGGRGYGGGRRRDDTPRGGAGRDKYGPPTRTEYRVIVENLSSRCSWQDLKDFMRKAGEVTYADAHKQAPNEGIVEFASYSDMRTAIDKLDDTELNGRRIRIVEDRGGKRNNRSASRSRSRSRRRSESHSKSRSKSPRNEPANRSRSHSKENNGRSASRSVSPDKN